MSIKVEKTLTILNKLGLHARAATKLVTLANSFKSDIQVKQGEHTAPANSVLALLMLESNQGKQVVISCEGVDAEEAMKEVENLIVNKFDEGE